MTTAPRPSAARPTDGRTLIAGVGNVFLSDDGFGVETVRRLTGRPLPAGADLMDVGIRGVHLAYRLLDGYTRLVLVDAAPHGAEPGTVSLIDATAQTLAPAPDAGAPGGLDGHGMDPATVLALVRELSAGAGGSVPGQVLVVACEPQCTDEGIGLSEPVEAAVDHAADLALEVAGRPYPGPGDEVSRPTSHEGDRNGTDMDGRRGRRDGTGRGLRDGEDPAGPPALPADPQDVTR
ncbi:hydrogenase maturation protease [Streptomyces sp. bgisy100]|uniref:hydrogenase maturation protease n=1 Tax=Streptomyces sp. bgisy100 TaxID=3413783 RepID=UPI003D728FDE